MSDTLLTPAMIIGTTKADSSAALRNDKQRALRNDNERVRA